MHKARIEKEKDRVEKLYLRLSDLEHAMIQKKNISITAFLETIEEIAMHEKYFSKEQLKELENRRKELGPEKIQNVQKEWPVLISEVRKEMELGTDPNDPRVQALGLRWQKLVEAFTGGDVKIGLSMRNMFNNEPSVREKAGMDPKLTEYVAKIMYCLSKKGIKQLIDSDPDSASS
jgi:hypothetical protein